MECNLNDKKFIETMEAEDFTIVNSGNKKHKKLYFRYNFGNYNIDSNEHEETPINLLNIRIVNAQKDISSLFMYFLNNSYLMF